MKKRSHYANKPSKFKKKSLGEEHPEYAASLTSLANLYRLMGRYDQAELLHKQAIGVAQKSFGEEHPLYARALNELANLYYLTGRYDQSKSLFQKVINIEKKSLGEEHPEYAKTLSNLAFLYKSMRDYDQAEAVRKQALSIQRKTLGEEHSDYATSLIGLADLYRLTGRYDRGEVLLKDALNIKKKILGETHPEYAISLNYFAGLYQSMGRYDQAELLYKEGLSKHLYQIKAYFYIMSEKEKRQFYRSIAFNFEFFQSFAIARKTRNPAIAGAMYNNQLAMKALLLNSISKVKRLILNSGDKALIESYEKWLAEKEYLARVYTLSKAEIAQQVIDKDSLEAVVNDLEKHLSRQSQAFAAASDTTMIVWQDVKNRLQSGQAAVEMVRFRWYNVTWTDTVYYAALIITSETKDYPKLVLLENGNDLEGQHFLEYLKSRKGKNNSAYEHYWQPIAEKLAGIKKVYFSPDGIYNKINLNILPNPETGDYVLDEIDIHLVTNTKDILRFGEKRESNKVAQLFGRPAYNLAAQQHLVAANAFRGAPDGTWITDIENAARTRATFSDLPGTEKEIAGIASVLTDNGWLARSHLGPEALEEAVKAVDNPGVLHIATHGFFIESQRDEFRQGFRNVEALFPGENKLPQPIGTDPMLRSGLVLAGAETYLNAKEKYDTEDGILTAYEAANLSLDRTELVVLSACETGLGEVQNGEGVYGLQRAFKVAGAKTILMSLWKVDDAATQELMTAFYEAWLSGDDKRVAFRNAQMQIRDKYKLPEFWGAFVMVGE